MNKRLISILITFIGLIIIIVICTIVEIVDEKKNEKYDIVVNDITNASKECVKDKKCNEGKITLKELYDKKYLEKQTNPKTDKYFNKNSYIDYPDLSFYIK